MRWIFKFAVLCVLQFFLFCSGLVHAGSWQVIPIRVDLSAGAKTDVITIANNDSIPILFEVRAMRWLQNFAGQNIYEETEDLVYFPKKLTVPPNDERIIRIGIKSPQVPREKAYRLFLTEIPEPKKASEGAGVSIAIQFGVPIFVKPREEIPAGEIKNIHLGKESFEFTVENTGNVHFRIRTIDLVGTGYKEEEIFKEQIEGWYLLTESHQTFTSRIPEGSCFNLNAIDIIVNADQINFNETIKVDPEICGVD